MQQSLPRLKFPNTIRRFPMRFVAMSSPQAFILKAEQAGTEYHARFLVIGATSYRYHITERTSWKSVRRHEGTRLRAQVTLAKGYAYDLRTNDIHARDAALQSKRSIQSGRGKETLDAAQRSVRHQTYTRHFLFVACRLLTRGGHRAGCREFARAERSNFSCGLCSTAPRSNPGIRSIIAEHFGVYSILHYGLMPIPSSSRVVGGCI